MSEHDYIGQSDVNLLRRVADQESTAASTMSRGDAKTIRLAVAQRLHEIADRLEAFTIPAQPKPQQ